MAIEDNDPFASMGGGVFVNGGWLPKGHPGIPTSTTPAPTTSGTAAPPPAAPTAPAPSGGQPTSPDPFASMGGGVFLNGGWLPKGHPLASQATASAPNGAPPPAPPGAAAPAAGQPSTTDYITQQAQNASAYSRDPTSAPNPNTTNAGTQDVVRNSYLRQATQGTAINTNDPNFRQQADTYAAAIERSRRNAAADAAEATGPFATGALAGENRIINERAAQASAGFEAQLVGSELANRRQEIQTALAALGNQINSDLGRQLSKDLANINAQIQQLGIEKSSEQATNDLAFRVGDREAFYNNLALQTLLGSGV